MQKQPISDLEQQINHLYECKTLSEHDIIALCAKAKEILSNQNNIVYLRSPLTICGDIHGQFHELNEIFEIAGKVPFNNYLFLGDYVNRGFFSVETFSLLLALKVRYQNRITLLRGNHEARKLTQVYDFYDECLKKYGTANVWKAFTDVFDYLPLAAVVDNQLFCVHGGLSPTINTLEEINELDRVMQIPHEGPMCHLLWTLVDEASQNTWSLSPKGADYYFGQKVTQKFNHINNTKMIIRAHQLVMEGFKTVHANQLTTVFSAANYCYRCGNHGAFVEIDENLNIDFVQFEAGPRKINDTMAKRSPDYFM